MNKFISVSFLCILAAITTNSSFASKKPETQTQIQILEKRIVGMTPDMEEITAKEAAIACETNRLELLNLIDRGTEILLEMGPEVDENLMKEKKTKHSEMFNEVYRLTLYNVRLVEKKKINLSKKLRIQVLKSWQVIRNLIKSQRNSRYEEVYKHSYKICEQLDPWIKWKKYIEIAKKTPGVLFKKLLIPGTACAALYFFAQVDIKEAVYLSTMIGNLVTI